MLLRRERITQDRIIQSSVDRITPPSPQLLRKESKNGFGVSRRFGGPTFRSSQQ